jgi:hypothetical protein
MAFAIAPLGYRRYEPTPNGTSKDNSKFLKHESQIPITDYEAQREFGTDLIENFVKILNEERYRDGIQTGGWMGDPNMASDSGHAMRWLQTVFAGDVREKDHYWQQYNAKFGTTGSPQMGYGQQNTWNPSPYSGGYGGGYNQPPGMYAYGGNFGPQPAPGYRPSPHEMMGMEGGIRPIDDIMNRVKNLTTGNNMMRQAGPGMFPGMVQQPQMGGGFPGVPQTMPGMIKTASAGMFPGMVQQPQMMPGMNPSPAADLERKRQTIEEKFANSGAFGGRRATEPKQTYVSTGEKLQVSEL